jgi:hypothetical protein
MQNVNLEPSAAPSPNQPNEFVRTDLLLSNALSHDSLTSNTQQNPDALNPTLLYHASLRSDVSGNEMIADI